MGIDQTLVDIEAKVDDEFIERYGLSAGHSLVIEDDVAEALYQELKQKNLITHQFAGGTIGNTMHNYSVLADDRSVLLGVMCSNIEIGSYAYRYCVIPPAVPILTIYKRGWPDWSLLYADWRVRGNVPLLSALAT
ncbi:inosine-guanosine kinase [Escherichia coli]|uniref:Inosine-guanosine kinase n=1 Tax=Escherichia coli TaxID=562 RepID=A0A377DI93_ECOLX|nr:inosine-guanosine kinase [Escherichia coli]